MTDFKGFIGAAKRLDDIDLPRIASRIQCGEDELHALIDVETAGGGFDKLDRPRLLFEPHVFYRNLTGTKRDEAVRSGLAYSKWGMKPYPKDSYPRLKQAMEIDETAALKSASWGLGQILGENHKMVGYATPQAMVLAFMADEESHLEAMVQFIIAAGIADDLKAHRWAVVARVYNGAGYAANKYDVKLAAAYAKWAKIKDTPWTPGQPDDPGAPQAAPKPAPSPPPPDIPAEPPTPLPESPSPAPEGGVSVSKVATAGAAVTALASLGGWWTFGIVAVVAIAVVAFFIIRSRT